MRKNIFKTIYFLTLALVVGLLVSCVDAVETNYTELQELVATHEEREESKFTEESWSAYIVVYNEAVDLIEDNNASQSKVDEVTTKLENAINNLAPFVADTVALEAAIAEAETLKKEDYTSSTWSTLAFRLQAAKTLLVKEGATQKEVDASTNGLNEAIEKLVLK